MLHVIEFHKRGIYLSHNILTIEFVHYKDKIKVNSVPLVIKYFGFKSWGNWVASFLCN